MTKHKKIYEKIHGKTPITHDIHHIDWNHENNVIDNLISIPKKIHKLTHKYLGYVSREEFEKMIVIYDKLDKSKTYSIGYLNSILSKCVNTNKKDKLSIQCRLSMEYDIINYQSAPAAYS